MHADLSCGWTAQKEVRDGNWWPIETFADRAMAEQKARAVAARTGKTCRVRPAERWMVLDGPALRSFSDRDTANAWRFGLRHRTTLLGPRRG